MTLPSSEARIIRDAMKLLPQLAASQATSTPDLRSIYVARSHEDALDPARELIVGDRGVGKSFWSSVLADSTAKTAVSPFFPSLQLSKVRVTLGFAEGIGHEGFPSSRTIRELSGQGIAPDHIWRAVILNSFQKRKKLSDWPADWRGRADWVAGHAEKEELYLREMNTTLSKKDERHLIVFDALDRLANDWGPIYELDPDGHFGVR